MEKLGKQVIKMGCGAFLHHQLRRRLADQPQCDFELRYALCA